MFTWEDGELIEQSYVEINGQKHYVVPAKYKGSTPMTSSNLNKMQKYILGDLKIVGSLEINEGIDPSTYLPGTWEKQKMFLGGELIAFGNVQNTKTNTSYISKETSIVISDAKIPDKVFKITNYIDDILGNAADAITIKPKNIAGMIEADYCISGIADTSCEGLWFKGNGNPLLEGVTLEVGEAALFNLNPGKYGAALNKYIYKIDDTADFSDDDFFFVNPQVTPYNGSFCPCNGGVRCYLNVKVFAKKGATIWKRTA